MTHWIIEINKGTRQHIKPANDNGPVNDFYKTVWLFHFKTEFIDDEGAAATRVIGYKAQVDSKKSTTGTATTTGTYQKRAADSGVVMGMFLVAFVDSSHFAL